MPSHKKQKRKKMKKKTTTKHQINIKFHFFSCHPGWTGPNCDKCVPLPGCSHHGYCTKPMECLCKYGYDGHFCHNPTCRDGCNKTTGIRNSYFYIEKWTFKGMCEVYYRAKRDKKEATCL